MRGALALVPPADRGRVRAGAHVLRADLRRWSWPDSPAGDGLEDRVAAVVAAAAPRLPPDRLVLLARYALWAVRLDDRLDEPGADPGRLRALHDEVRDVLRTGRAAGGDPPAAALAGLLAQFRAAGGAPALLGAFAGALGDAVLAAVEQAEMRRQVYAGRRAPPAAGEYLATAARDVNYASFAYAAALLAGCRAEGGAAESGAALPAIERALAPAGRAVRLANDLRSVRRDRIAGRFNVLALRHRDGAPVRPGTVRRAIRTAVRRHDRLLRAPDAAAGCGPLLTNALHVAVGVYRLADLR